MSKKNDSNIPINPNTPNRLTMMRILLIPVFVALFEFGNILDHNYLFAFVVFAAASITDWFDGHLARKYNLVSDFGKLMDPLADKVLVAAALVCFVGGGFAPSWVVILILGREFLVTSLRLVAAAKGIVLAADKWGKYKTATTMVWICYGLLVFEANKSHWLGASAQQPAMLVYYVMMGLALFFTLYSGMNYLLKNKELISSEVNRPQ